MSHQVFVSYSHKDSEWLRRIKTFLDPLTRNKALALWDDSRIEPGKKWKIEISRALESAAVAILLVTPDFLASDFIANDELPPLLEAAEKRGLQIFWISVSAAMWEDTPLKHYQGANDPERPLDSIPPSQLNLELKSIATKIKAALSLSPPMPPPPKPAPSPHTVVVDSGPDLAGLKIVQIYRRNIQPDETLRRHVERELKARGCDLFFDRDIKIGIGWSREVENRIKEADAVVAFLSPQSMESEMVQYELQIAHEFAQLQDGKPRLLPVRVNYEGPLAEEIASLLSPIQYFPWRSPSENGRLIADLCEALKRPAKLAADEIPPDYGASTESKYYIVRDTDGQFLSALRRRDSIILIKGGRQIGKTSLLARGIEYAEKASQNPMRVVRTDFQKLNTSRFESAATFYMALARWIADQLKLEVNPENSWLPFRDENLNLEAFLRDEVLKACPSGLLWAMDEVDRLFGYPYANDFFGLVRSWHNDRALVSRDGWNRLTVAIAYATEAHLFITDLNQSPFNVGTLLELADFTFDQVADLNRRYESPVRSQAELAQLYELLGGHPFLIRRALTQMVRNQWPLDELEKRAVSEEGPFGDHLRRILVLMTRDEKMCESMRRMLLDLQKEPDERRSVLPIADFFRLRAAGVLVGQSAPEAAFRCRLYERYLMRHLCGENRKRTAGSA